VIRFDPSLVGINNTFPDTQPMRLVDISQEITQLFILNMDFRPIVPMVAI